MIRETTRPPSPLTLPPAAMPRSFSPTSVRDYPTMAVPRTYWQVNRGNEVHIIDLYATVNHMFRLYQRYIINPTRWGIIHPFLQEIRYGTFPNMARWPQVPHPNYSYGEGMLMAEDWLIQYGIKFDLVDLTMVFSDEEEDDGTEDHAIVVIGNANDNDTVATEPSTQSTGLNTQPEVLDGDINDLFGEDSEE